MVMGPRHGGAEDGLQEGSACLAAIVGSQHGLDKVQGSHFLDPAM